jgi:APA family basic amino acid/polyamine antiporter
MGEMPAVAAGACITLEYIGAASAVARSWADKVVAFIITYYHPMIHDQEDEGGDESSLLLRILQPGYGLNPMAFCISLISVLLLLRGVKESKQVTNFFTVVKLTLIAFMSIASLSLMQRENLFPLLPSRFGLTGILRGTSSSFFGYIGFDEICCMGGEVVNPSKNLPRAVMGTIGLVTVLYVIAAIGLVGMVPYEYISVTSGFPDGFGYRGHDIIAQMTALGEIVTLPIVVLVTLMAQPRLQYAMAKDGLLPSIFAKVDATNNLWHGTLIAGTIMIIISTCVPFTYLNDLISAGVLMAFGMTAASVVLLRLKSPNDQPFLLERLLIKFNVLSLTMGLLIQLGLGDLTGQLLPVLNFLMLVALAVRIGNSCPAVPSAFGADYFEIPFVPYLPLFAQFLNWYLVGQLGPLSIMLLIGYNGFFIMLYYIFKTDKSRDCDLCSQISMASINNEEDVRF